MSADTPRRSPNALMEELKRLRELSAHERQSLLHEISTYQEELLAQNEALSHAQTTLEEVRDRFIELYDFSPTGYFTLDHNGVVRECNLTASSLLGKPRHAIQGLPFLAFVESDDRGAYMDFLRKSRLTDQAEIDAELTIRCSQESRRVQLCCRVRHDPNRMREFFVSLVDVTERRRLEREHEQIARDRAALASRLLSIQDEERQRIARNLHDDIGQQVTALRLRLDTLVSTVPDATSSPAVERILEMLQQLDRALHFVASELHPAALDLGIAVAMEQFVREWSANFGVNAEFHAAGIERDTLAPHIATHVFRIAQEALHNVAKHATARQVTVLLERRHDDVVLVVEDNGRGFDLESARNRGEGLGLLSMRERAQIVGGSFEVDSRPGNGTSIFVHVPAGDGTTHVP